jgi:hypothetical protein
VILNPNDGGNIPARLIFVRNRSNRNDYLVLLCTGMSMDEDDIIRTYGKRWSFESSSSLQNPIKNRQRPHQDTRSIGDLLFDAFDELQDISYRQSLFLILSAILHAVTEALTSSSDNQKKMVDAFISTVPSILAKRLECAP